MCDEPNDNAAKWQTCRDFAARSRRLWPQAQTLVTATVKQATAAQAVDQLDLLVVLANSATYPYAAETGYMYHVGNWEVLNIRWPNPNASTVLGGRRPVRDESGSVGMTFTHGDLG